MTPFTLRTRGNGYRDRWHKAMRELGIDSRAAMERVKAKVAAGSKWRKAYEEVLRESGGQLV